MAWSQKELRTAGCVPEAATSFSQSDNTSTDGIVVMVSAATPLRNRPFPTVVKTPHDGTVYGVLELYDDGGDTGTANVNRRVSVITGGIVRLRITDPVVEADIGKGIVGDPAVVGRAAVSGTALTGRGHIVGRDAEGGVNYAYVDLDISPIK